MANKIQFKRGVKANLPTLSVGEPAFTTDTNEFFIGNGTSNIQLAKKTEVDAKINKSSVVNNTVTTAEGTVLDGRVGKTLQDQITTIYDNLVNKFKFYDNITDITDILLSMSNNAVAFFTAGGAAYTGVMPDNSNLNYGAGMLIRRAGDGMCLWGRNNLVVWGFYNYSTSSWTWMQLN